MKTIITLILLAVLTSCSGYFDDSYERYDQGDIKPLAISGGGYLSTINHNEVTPFLYRDTNSGRAWLFYSTDRDETYDIFCSEMNPDGTFHTPVKLGAPVNTISNETSPVVFLANSEMNISVKLYLTVIQYLNTNTNVITFEITNYPASFDSAVVSIAALVNTNATHLSLSDTASYNPTLEFSMGRSVWQGITWESASSAPFGWAGVSAYTRTTDTPELTVIQSVSIGDDSTEVLLYGKSYLGAGLVDGKWQLLDIANFTTPLTNFALRIGILSSRHNDRDAFVDFGRSGKIYFASDRYGQGNYDLYRYNHILFNSVLRYP